MKQTFKPTPAMLTAGKTVFMAMAHESVVRDIVEGYQKEILSFYKWKLRPDIATRRGNTPDEIVTDPKYSYMLSDEDFALYHKECKAARDKAGLKVTDDEFCPLLCAECLTSDAKKVLIEVMEPVTKIPLDVIIGHYYKYKELVEITLKLLAPYCNSNEMMKSLTL